MNGLTVSSGNNQFMVGMPVLSQVLNTLGDVGLLIWPITDADNLHSEVYDSGFCH
jgi:hypothetical protein